MFQDYTGEVVAEVKWHGTSRSQDELVPLFFLRRTLGGRLPQEIHTRGPGGISRKRQTYLVTHYGPLTPPRGPEHAERQRIAEMAPEGEEIFLLEQNPEQVHPVIDRWLKQQQDVVIVVPREENTMWFGRLLQHCKEYEPLPPERPEYPGQESSPGQQGDNGNTIWMQLVIYLARIDCSG